MAREPIHRQKHGKVARAAAWRVAECTRLRRMLAGHIALVMPSTACPALLLNAGAERRNWFYEVALAVHAIAGHAGLPQVTLPVGSAGGAPIGLSIVGPPDSDLSLLALAAQWREPARR